MFWKNKKSQPEGRLALLIIPDDDRLKMDCGAMAQQIREPSRDQRGSS